MKLVKDRLDEFKEMEVAQGVVHLGIWIATDMARLLDKFAQYNRVTLHHQVIEILREWSDTHVSVAIIRKGPFK